MTSAALGSIGSEPTEGPCSPLQQCHCPSASPAQPHGLVYAHVVRPVVLCCHPLQLDFSRVKNNSKFLSLSCTRTNKENFEVKVQHGPFCLAPLAGAFASGMHYPGICGNSLWFPEEAAAFLTVSMSRMVCWALGTDPTPTY